MTDDAFLSENKRDQHGRFIVPPKSPGRPKGSRNKLGEAFVADMLKDWEVHGAATIVQVREERPTDYLKVVASVIPKEVNVTVNEYDELSDDDLAEQFAAIAAQLGYGGGGVGGRDTREEAPALGGPKPH